VPNGWTLDPVDASNAAHGALRFGFSRLGNPTLRRAGSLLTTPLLPGDYLSMVNPLWSQRQINGRVLQVMAESADAATLVISGSKRWSFDYEPGQHLGIGARVDGRWIWRPYSLTSVPETEDRLMSIAVKAVPEGRLSGHLVRLSPGAIIRLGLPQGDFVLPNPIPGRLFFWTAGSGITPVVGMLRTLRARGTLTDVVHLHLAPSSEDFMFGEELRGLAAESSAYQLREHFDGGRATFDPSDRSTGLASICPDWRLREAWVCGPDGMLDAAVRQWRDAGIAHRLHVERFSARIPDSAHTTTGGRVTYARSGLHGDLDGATSLLDGGEALGVPVPAGCRMGLCHTCVTRLDSGHARDLRNGTRHDPGDRIQTCVSAAAGDCALDL